MKVGKYKFVFLFILITLFIFFFSNAFRIQNDGGRFEKIPLELNVTYETQMRDLDEERKFTLEHLNFVKKVKRLEKKLIDDMEALKMMVNMQTVQIDKLNEILNVNAAIAGKFLYQKAWLEPHT